MRFGGVGISQTIEGHGGHPPSSSLGETLKSGFPEIERGDNEDGSGDKRE